MHGRANQSAIAIGMSSSSRLVLNTSFSAPIRVDQIARPDCFRGERTRLRPGYLSSSSRRATASSSERSSPGSGPPGSSHRSAHYPHRASRLVAHRRQVLELRTTPFSPTTLTINGSMSAPPGFVTDRFSVHCLQVRRCRKMSLVPGVGIEPTLPLRENGF